MKTWTLLCLFGLSLALLGAGEFTIGNGNLEEHTVPVDGYWDYGWSRMIITKAEINAAGITSATEITGLGLRVQNLPANYIFHTQNIFLRHYTLNAYNQINVPLPDSTLFTQVFSGDLRFHGSGWLQIAFSTPFLWNGTDHLEIFWKNYDGSRQANYPIFSYAETANTVAYKHADGAFPTSTGTRDNKRPNLQLITAMTPNSAQVVYPQENGWALANSSLLWKGGGGCPASYDVYLGTDNPPQTLVSDDQADTAFLPGLQPNTTYYWRIVPANASGSAENCPVWTFATPGSNQLAEGFESAVFPPPGWSNPGGLLQSDLFPYQGEKNLYTSVGTAGKMIVTPQLSIRADSRLSFAARKYDAAQNSRIRIKYSADGSDWIQLGSPVVLASNTAWTLYNFDLGSLAGTSCFVGLDVYNAGTSGLVQVYLDQIVGPAQAGSLAAPEVSVSLSGGSVRLDWPAVPDAGSYRVYASQDPAQWGAEPLAILGADILSYELPAASRRFFRVTALQNDF